MSKLDVRDVVGDGILALRRCRNLCRGDEEKLRLWINEARDEPRAGDPIDTSAFAIDPFYRLSLLG